jgi:hypothetical protein
MSQPESDPRPRPPESKLVAFGKEIYGIWISERPTQFAAALAYYAIFSFVPVIYIAFTITELVIERLSVEQQFYAQIANVLGAEIAQALQDAVTSLAQRTAGDTTLTTVIGFVALAFTASLAFFQLQHALNTIWKVPPPRRGQTRAYVLNRLLALAMVLGVALLLIVAAVASPELCPDLQGAAQRERSLAARVGGGSGSRAVAVCGSVSGQALSECRPHQLGPGSRRGGRRLFDGILLPGPDLCARCGGHPRPGLDVGIPDRAAGSSRQA